MRIKKKDLPARVYSVKDSQSDSRETVINGRRLPYQERIRLKKLAQRTKARNLLQIRSLRIATLNVGSMTGKSIELIKMMEKRGINIMCVQEAKWKGSKAKEIGDGFKLFYLGMHNKRNGVGIILNKELKENVIGVTRVSDRVMSSSVCKSRGGFREKSDQGSTKSSWAWLYGCGKYLRTMNKKGPVGPTFIIDMKFDILSRFSKEAIKHVVYFALFC